MINANDLAEDLARTLSGEKDDVNIEKLKADMRTCADHYGVPDTDRREMWAVALRNLPEAAECFDAIAGLVLGPVRYINERLEDSIALERCDGMDAQWRTPMGNEAYEHARKARL